MHCSCPINSVRGAGKKKKQKHELLGCRRQSKRRFYLQNYTIKYILIYYHYTVVLILFYHWNVISSLTLYSWSHKSYKEQSDAIQLESETHKISQYFSIFKITLLSTCYFNNNYSLLLYCWMQLTLILYHYLINMDSLMLH